jgi:hypothetical protein
VSRDIKTSNFFTISTKVFTDISFHFKNQNFWIICLFFDYNTSFSWHSFKTGTRPGPGLNRDGDQPEILTGIGTGTRPGPGLNRDGDQPEILTGIGTGTRPGPGLNRDGDQPEILTGIGTGTRPGPEKSDFADPYSARPPKYPKGILCSPFEYLWRGFWQFLWVPRKGSYTVPPYRYLHPSFVDITSQTLELNGQFLELIVWHSLLILNVSYLFLIACLHWSFRYEIFFLTCHLFSFPYFYRA